MAIDRKLNPRSRETRRKGLRGTSVPENELDFGDGPFHADGSWRPKFGRELYFHAHLSDPADRLDQDGLDQVDTATLDLADWIICNRKLAEPAEPQSDVAGAGNGRGVGENELIAEPMEAVIQRVRELRQVLEERSRSENGS
jgi:hypothetical protein